MHKDEIKGKVNDIKGRVERQAGEWTGDTESQIKGAGDQLKGKVQQGVGKMKDAGNKAMRDLRNRGEREGSDVERDVQHEERKDRKVA
jgi:uncharacterized protein YjbJ (UPF0337 family)